MGSHRSNAVDVVMLGSFGVWTRGTLQSRALPLACALTSDRGLRVAIVTTPWDDPSQAGVTEIVNDVLIHNTRTTRQALFPVAVSEQLRALDKLQPRLVHVMKPKAFAGLAAQTRLAHGTKLLVDHDDWEGDGGWNRHAGYSAAARRLFEFQERHLLQNADGVTAASTLLEERATRLRQGQHEPAVTYLPNGLDASWLARLNSDSSQQVTADPKDLVLYSRFAEFTMGWLGETLRTLDRMIERPVTLHVIGLNDPGDPNLEGFKHIRMRWHGYIEREDVPGLLSTSSIALFPYEDNLINRSKQSVKLLELMASGCAVVASDVGDVRRIGGDALIAVEPGDADEYARAVYALFSDPGRATFLGERARERASRFTIDRLAARLFDAYRECGLR